MDVQKLYPRALNTTILIFTIALVWFSFVYYPGMVKVYKNGNFQIKNFVPAVVASSRNFPIETPDYRIIWEKESGVYYVLATGDSLDKFVVNKQGAQLALKTALSVSTLCNLNIIYVSTANLKVPPQFQEASDCD